MGQLDDYIKEYVLEVSERIDLLNDLILDIEANIKKSASYEDQLKELILIVHTTKGSAGSYGLNIASTICHNIEDVIEVTDEKLTLDDCDKIFTLIDLLRDYFSDIENSTFEKTTEIKQKILMLSTENATQEHKALIVKPSKSLQKIYVKHLKSCGVSTSFCTTGYEALGRVLQESFDSIITANQIGFLDGISLIKTIKVLRPQSDFKAFLVSSSKGIQVEEKFAPDKILIKDRNLGLTVNKTYTELLRNEELDSQENISKVSQTPLERIAYIDDDPSLHKLLDIALSGAERLNITHYTSGKEALNNIESASPQLIILDLLMPEMRGEEVHDRIKEIKAVRDVPVVYMTGMQDESELKSLTNRGAMSIIQKPFRPKELLSNILTIWDEIQSKSSYGSNLKKVV